MNTIATVAAKINAYANQFLILPESLEVTSYEQMGPNVRVFYKRNLTLGKTPEQVAKLRQKVIMGNALIPDPFADDVIPDPDPEPGVKPVTGFTVTLATNVVEDETTPATVNITPANADDKTYTVVANPTGIVEILNGGALIKGVKTGTTQLTYHANGGTVPDVVKTIEVTAIPVAAPTAVLAEIVSDQFTDNTATPLTSFTIESIVEPSNASQEVTVTSDGSLYYTLDENGVYTLNEDSHGQTIVFTVTTVADSSIKDTLTLTVLDVV